MKFSLQPEGCISPYAYAGLSGGPFHPILSDWPSPQLVVDVCCEVFNTQGRGLRVYRSSVKKIGVRISKDHIAGYKSCEMIEDLRAMCVYILHNYCLWMPSTNEVPRKYTMTIIGEYFERKKYWSSKANRRATDLLAVDLTFQSLYADVEQELREQGFKLRRITI